MALTLEQVDRMMEEVGPRNSAGWHKREVWVHELSTSDLQRKTNDARFEEQALSSSISGAASASPTRTSSVPTIGS